jgi:hypothetical protein
MLICCSECIVLTLNYPRELRCLGLAVILLRFRPRNVGFLLVHEGGVGLPRRSG